VSGTGAIRAAGPQDAPAIAALLRAAFPSPAEADLVAALRRDGDAVVELVAAADDAVRGHVLFSPMTVGGRPALALAPLAVAPAAQRRGIGAALVRAGLAAAVARPEEWCLVLGAPAYYGRFGFAATDAAGVTALPWSGHPAFQALRLRADAPRLAGPGRYACAFGLGSPEDAPR
jgi:putative acetyltransferase